MICLAYLSTATCNFTSEELAALLAQSRRNNTAADVTGMLCHYDGSFLQFLEGPAVSVEATFDRISRDSRHGGLLRLYAHPVGERLFGDWSMAVVDPGAMGVEQHAFCRGLRALEVGTTDVHRQLIEPFLSPFRAWIR